VPASTRSVRAQLREAKPNSTPSPDGSAIRHSSVASLSRCAVRLGQRDCGQWPGRRRP
jgi:hypothetical protein